MIAVLDRNGFFNDCCRCSGRHEHLLSARACLLSNRNSIFWIENQEFGLTICLGTRRSSSSVSARQSAAKLPTKNEARRIATNIAKLRELLRKAKWLSASDIYSVPAARTGTDWVNSSRASRAHRPSIVQTSRTRNSSTRHPRHCSRRTTHHFAPQRVVRCRR